MLKSLWAGLVHVVNIITFSPAPDLASSQHPLSNQPIHHANPPAAITTSHHDGDTDTSYIMADGTPVVGTPKSPQEGVAGGLNCAYPDMSEWEPCYRVENRTCWLKKKDGSKYIDIGTNYEDPLEVPFGTTRKFHLEVSEQPISPDGVTMENGKLFNRTYPGPWIEACWGDKLEITVTNNLRYNGTSVHWHGMRQLNSFHHDGVNGVTECPIAPGSSVTYKFRALQYGSAWYHSHYSMQYGDGLLGPITIYGPSTANFDKNAAFRPLLMTDWNHRSVFQDWPLMLADGSAPEMTNILFNGTGQFGRGPKPNKYSITLEATKKYMLILINTSVDTTFVFAIDNHTLEVIEMDFVPIHPYTTNHVLVGIGQWCHVIVHGLERPFEAERYGNYWMRAIPARKCSKFTYGPDEQMGVVRYDQKMADLPRPPDPLSEPPLYSISCADEPYAKLKPWVPWTVEDPFNIDPTWGEDEDLPNDKKYIFNVGMTSSGGPGSGTPYIPDDKPYTRWDMHIAPFRINFSDPTLLALERLPSLVDQPHLDIVTVDDESGAEGAWIWMVITAPDKVPTNGGRIFFPAAHPMHLHGHDFALLRQSSKNFYDDESIGHVGEGHRLTPDQLNCKNPLIKCENPPRRDVVLLPASGYIVIAFKADNPGAWLIHCHIAFHASSGLAMQIIENKHLIPAIIKDDLPLIESNCEKWRTWFDNPMNHWEWNHPTHFQDDSGV